MSNSWKVLSQHWVCTYTLTWRYSEKSGPEGMTTWRTYVVVVLRTYYPHPRFLSDRGTTHFNSSEQVGRHWPFCSKGVCTRYSCRPPSPYWSREVFLGPEYRTESLIEKCLYRLMSLCKRSLGNLSNVRRSCKGTGRRRFVHYRWALSVKNRPEVISLNVNKSSPSSL